MLHRAEGIVLERSRLYSLLHLNIVHSIASVFMLRSMLVAVSKRLHLWRTLPPRCTGRFSREHPAIVRMAVIKSEVRDEFGEIVVFVTQRYWREHRRRAHLRGVCESSAQEMQRLGRAFLVRRARLHLYRGYGTAEDILLAAQRYAMRTCSRRLIRAAALF
ncbi:hypothetical protein LSCM1_05808 [Leishmania martiniquensis]|uniref:Uncharacterized protein n=1 Tax=Leishmania martiniquensis TaxID=1580590 RepID=A0A836KNP2_9TRYP|nr:hypothetical protein LSCM1_05808 [Leishmania martiniquensis]